MIATMPWGTEIPLAPFFDVMGVAPPPYGAISTVEPREHGGNIDNKELVAGTTIFGSLFGGSTARSVAFTNCPLSSFVRWA
jgi:acetamidase/formamidase